MSATQYREETEKRITAYKNQAIFVICCNGL